MQKLSVDIIAIVISNPIKIGIYHENKLIKTIEKEGLTSEILPLIFKDLLNNYNINSIVYSKGPGSFMAIKLSYIFFKSLEIARNIKLLSQDGFYFNNNSPIKAIKNSFFVKKKDIITIEKNQTEGIFKLPSEFKRMDFLEDTDPLYVIKAV